MAANNIGNAALKLSTDGKQAKADLDAFNKHVTNSSRNLNQSVSAGLGASVAQAGPGMAGGVRTLFGGIGGMIGSAWGPVGSMIGGLLGSTIGKGAGEAISALTAPIEHLGELAKINKQADVLGLSASDLQGMGLLLKKVGVEGDKAVEIFSKLGKGIEGGDDKAKVLEKMGLSLDQLRGKSLTDQFRLISDGINKLPRGAEQAAAALGLFEEAGSHLLPILQKGSAGIDEFIAHARKTGAVLSDEELERAGQAAAAWKQAKEGISQLWDGLYNRMTLVAAPFIKTLSEGWSRLITFVTPVFEYVNRVLVRVGDIASAVFDVVGKVIEFVFQEMQSWGSALEEFTGAWPTVEQVVTGACKTIGMAMGYLWDSMKVGVGIVAVVVGGVITSGLVPLMKAFKDTTQFIIDETKTFVLGVIEMARSITAVIPGMADVSKQLGDLSYQVDMWARKNANTDTFAKKLEDLGTGLIKFGVDQENAFGQSADRIAQWFDSLVFGAKKAKKEVQSVKPPAASEYHAIKGSLLGSAEANSIVNKFKWESVNGTQKKADERNNEELKKMNGKLDKIIEVWGMAIPLKVA